MFQIASSKVNQSLMQRKKNPVFNLQFTEPFENQDDINGASGEELDEIASMFGSEMDGSKANLQSTILNQQTSRDVSQQDNTLN